MHSASIHFFIGAILFTFAAAARTNLHSHLHARHTHSPVMKRASMPSVIRGVNIGNWLVLEKWMDTTNLFSGAFANAVDQWTFDSTPGALQALQNHWSTWFTESDVQILAGWGINALRIPIGYWAYDSVVQAPYLQGADAYLEQAIGWARTYGMVVLIDLHGAPGSQNGWDASGHVGAVQWQQDQNLKHTKQSLRHIATKYGQAQYSDVVFGIELVNEPISWGNNSFPKTQNWSKKAFHAIQNVTSSNPDLNIIMHDSFQGPSSWLQVGSDLNGGNSMSNSRFWIDTHLYQNQVASDSELDQTQHLQKACGYATTTFLPSSDQMPVIVGEFSPQTNVCVNPDGTTTSGNSCSVSGCQCSATTPIENWNEPLKAATRQMYEAQIQTFEAHSLGWFIWAYKGPGTWGLNNLIQYGAVGNPVNQYEYPNICANY